MNLEINTGNFEKNPGKSLNLETKSWNILEFEKSPRQSLNLKNTCNSCKVLELQKYPGKSLNLKIKFYKVH